MSEQREQARLSDIASDVLLLILQLRATRTGFGDPEILRQRILGFVDSFERHAKNNNYRIEDIQQAKFALVAFIDEILITSDWDKKEKWFEKPLQLQLYDRFDAGDKFYEKLSELRRQAYNANEILEIYYICLTLGFKGKYAVMDQDKLRLTIDNTYHDIMRVRGKVPNILSPSGKPKEDITDVIKKEVPLWIFGIGAFAFGFIFYITIILLSKSEAGRTIDFIRGLL